MGAALAVLASAVVVGAGGNFTIVAGGARDQERIGAYRFGVEPTYAAAVKALGRPASLGADETGGACVVHWRRLGLEMRFGSGVSAPCSRDGLSQGAWAGATVYAGSWRTAIGLRVGDSVARLRSLYPQARFVDGPPDPPSWLLVYRRGEVGLIVYLQAYVWAGRVTALDVPPGNVSVARS